MKLYFGNAVTTATTLMILALLGFIGWSVFNRANIQYWGRRSAVLLVFGLVVCCFAAARDGLDKTIQHAIDGSCTPGLFPLVSVPTIVGCVGAHETWLVTRNDVQRLEASFPLETVCAQVLTQLMSSKLPLSGISRWSSKAVEISSFVDSTSPADG